MLQRRTKNTNKMSRPFNIHPNLVQNNIDCSDNVILSFPTYKNLFINSPFAFLIVCSSSFHMYNFLCAFILLLKDRNGTTYHSWSYKNRSNNLKEILFFHIKWHKNNISVAFKKCPDYRF